MQSSWCALARINHKEWFSVCIDKNLLSNQFFFFWEKFFCLFQYTVHDIHIFSPFMNLVPWQIVAQHVQVQTCRKVVFWDVLRFFRDRKNVSKKLVHHCIRRRALLNACNKLSFKDFPQMMQILFVIDMAERTVSILPISINEVCTAHQWDHGLFEIIETFFSVFTLKVAAAKLESKLEIKPSAWFWRREHYCSGGHLFCYLQ